MRISDWSSDVCSSDLYSDERKRIIDEFVYLRGPTGPITGRQAAPTVAVPCTTCLGLQDRASFSSFSPKFGARYEFSRSEEHTSELQSLMRISYAVFCLKKKKIPTHIYCIISNQHRHISIIIHLRPADSLIIS